MKLTWSSRRWVRTAGSVVAGAAVAACLVDTAFAAPVTLAQVAPPPPPPQRPGAARTANRPAPPAPPRSGIGVRSTPAPAAAPAQPASGAQGTPGSPTPFSNGGPLPYVPAGVAPVPAVPPTTAPAVPPTAPAAIAPAAQANVTGDGAVSLSASSGYACALTGAGALKCWPIDASGKPAAVAQGFSSGVLAMSVGASHTWPFGWQDTRCVVNSSSALQCWGSNGMGQLANGGHEPSPVPALVKGLTSGVKAVAMRTPETPRSACALTKDGNVYCWGNNGGVLGNGTDAAESDTPVQIVGFSGPVTAISVGDGFGCAIVSGGAVQCWGANNAGQLGNGQTEKSNAPVQVTGLTQGVTSIVAANGFACAVASDGSVQCWGRNDGGQLGNGMQAGSLTPTPVTGITGATAVSAAAGTACAIAGGAVKCWGVNGSGQLGNNSTTLSLLPVQVTTLTRGAYAVSVGAGFACAATGSGSVWCWGGPSHEPVRVAGFP